ncbi:MAG: S8 family serine peptidase, partial [Planctomycetia bacterium]|nr:S8 family serine peptidase [Planctomycetia bacterium]
GSGQTVAIIDSGIAYDDVALGGGLGNAYKVVGGWDFAENDANPYDDGPAGFHGTHVSGIVGSQDSRYAGVAPNVDLVGLRVFDDQGNGYFTWVDQALQWVHTHRNDYEFPITTVNLSLGTEWNANTLPQWATLETDLKQLADDGIFISVAAGNSFLNYNAPGLSYPAVSPNVTPVASVDANGNLSRFSQRNDHVLAAPGEKIMSTLPPAFYGDSSNKSNFGAASGTSMAAPYVAGASVLVREAMQDLGYSNIKQSAIDDLFHRTADKVFDSVTNASYDRINVARALGTLVGPDDFGGAASGSSSVGQLSTTLHVGGTINSTSDQDYFQFTAARTGKVTLTLTEPQQLTAAWQPMAGGQIAGNKLTLNVLAGQSYVVGVGGGGTTIGKYGVDMQLSAAAPSQDFTAVNWGTIDQRNMDNVAISGTDAWFQVTAGHNGRFTAEAFYTQNRGNVDIEIYNAQQRLLGSSSGSERIDVDVAACDTLYLHVKGANPDVDFRLTNLVAINGNTAAIAGTAGNDIVRWQADGQLSVNGVTYAISGVTQVTIEGGGGNDALTLVGNSAAENVTLRPGSADITASNYHVAASGFESIQFSGSSSDRATLYDSAGDDVFEATPQWARLSGAGYVNYVSGVGSVVAISQTAGSDTARLYDSAGNDTLTASPTSALLQGNGFSNEARGFAQVNVIATAGGYDSATLSDSAGADQLDATPSYVWLRGTGYSIRAEGFDYIAVVATYGSNDTARLVGSDGDDSFGVWWNQRDLYTSTVQIHTYNFQMVQFDGGGGYDAVNYYQASKNASLSARSNYGQINDQLFATQFSGVEAVMATVRSSQRLRTDLAALDFAFQKMGRK